MNHKIPCDMILDLLPLYVDGLTRETTDREIEEHLRDCPDCRGSLETMKASFAAQKEETRREAAKEINYLKTIQTRNTRKIIGAVLGSVLLMVTALGIKVFVLGSPSESYVITYLETMEDEIHVGGTFVGSATVYTRHKLVKQPDGSQKLVIYAGLASSWNRKGVFNLILDKKQIQEKAEIGGATVTKDGAVITRLANQLYDARNPYIGDASADGRLTRTLGLGERLGGFTNELQTDKEPYGWTLQFEDSVRNSASFEARMKDYACVLLALTDNLGEVSWVYTVETEEKAVTRQTTWTSEEASGYLGAPVKSFGESPEKVQELLDKINLAY